MKLVYFHWWYKFNQQNKQMNLTKIFSIVIISMLLVSCSSKKKDDEKIRPVEELYNEGMNKMNDGQYKKAIEDFEELERTYPYSKWAIKAEIMSAYTNFKNEDYTSAIAVLDKFISLHPGNADIAYAYYLKALCYYQQVSDIERDQGYSVLARDAMKEVVARFPETDYARDAQGKIDLVTDHLAGKEVEVGRFYLKSGKYIAAINRFKEVIEKYQTTSHAPEALHRLVEANMALGLSDEATKYASVLGYNYPGSKWYKYSYDLMKGKGLSVPKEGDYSPRAFGVIRNPFKKFRQQPNLADHLDRKVNELTPEEEKANKILPLEIKPSDPERAVKVEPIKIDENKPNASSQGMTGSLKKVGGWFKGLKMPFSKKSQTVEGQ